MCQSSVLMQRITEMRPVIVATRDRGELSSQPPFPPQCTARVTQLSEVLELLIEKPVLEVSFLSEVSSQQDFHSYSSAWSTRMKRKK